MAGVNGRARLGGWRLHEKCVGAVYIAPA